MKPLHATPMAASLVSEPSAQRSKIATATTRESGPASRMSTDTAFVALTHDPKIDDPGLHAALSAACFYVGALGSRKTHARRVERLTAAGFDAAAIARIRAPIGLPIGAVSPAEIALAILGEITAALRQGPGSGGTAEAA